MSLTVADLLPAAGGSRDAAEMLIEAILDVKRFAREQTIGLKTAHAEQLAALKRKMESDLAALRTEHQQAFSDRAAKHAGEIEELRRQLAVARKKAAEVRTLGQTLYSVRHASALLTVACLVCSVSSNRTDRPVFLCRTVARSMACQSGATSSTLTATTSQPRSLLSRRD